MALSLHTVFLLWGFSLGIFQGYRELDVFVNFNFQWQVKKIKGYVFNFWGLPLLSRQCIQFQQKKSNVFNNGME